MQLPLSFCLLSLAASMMASAFGAREPLKCIVYLTGQHPIVPSSEKLEHITHVALAFMSPAVFNTDNEQSSWPLFMSVEDARHHFFSRINVMVAIGGWGDTKGFSEAAANDISRKTFAKNVARMVQDTGADGVDVDWEYPGGNGEDYKTVPNREKAWEIDAYPLLLAELRSALGPDKLVSAAVPGLERDMLAFTRETVPRIMRHVDFLNVMTYDMMNRRDNRTKHHTGVQICLEAVSAYVRNGAAPQRLNLGFAFYIKYFRTTHDGCAERDSPVGCPTVLLEDPETGADLGQTGGFAWHDAVPTEVGESFNKALANGIYDEVGGGYYFWDDREDIWWTFDTPSAIKRKFPLIVEKRRLGGVFAWGLGEDAPRFEHLNAVNEGIDALERGAREEL